MKIDVTMTQNPEDLSLSGQLKHGSLKTNKAEVHGIYQSRKSKKNGRLEQQIGLESFQMNLIREIDGKLDFDGVWLERKEHLENGSCSSNTDQCGNKLADGDEVEWSRTSSGDSPVAVDSVEDDFRNDIQNLETGSLEYPRIRMSRYLEKAGTTDSSRNPRQVPEQVLERSSDTSLNSSPMEADISSFFPNSNSSTRGRSVDVLPSKIQGSPRQRLLYRYRMEELRMNHQGDLMDSGSGLLPDEFQVSASPEPMADAQMDEDGSSSAAEYAESAGSPGSWRSLKNGEEDMEEEEELPSHSASGVVRDCHICGYSPCSRDDYDDHMKKIHFTHKCRLCIYWSRSPGRLNRHMKNFHSEPGSEAPTIKKPKNPRKYTCKQCNFFTYIQEEIWNHTRVHVPASKLLSCPHCPFVCAFKHHMQYHMNNHMGYKPFKCSECNYRCNNKSMLNSHKKSHSNDYPFRCGVCNYAAKYRHALNIHLRKKKHIPDGEVLLLDDGHRPTRSRNRCNTAPSQRTRTKEHFSQLGERSATAHQDGRGGLVWPESQMSGMLDLDPVKHEQNRLNNSVISFSSSQSHRAPALPRATIQQPPVIPISELSHVQHLLGARYSPVMVGCPVSSMTTVLAPPQNRTISQLQNDLPSIPVPSVPSSLIGKNHSAFGEVNDPFRAFSNCRQIPPKQNYYTNISTYDSVEHDAPYRHHSPEVAQDFGSDSADDWPLDLTAKSKNDKIREVKDTKSWTEAPTETPQLDWYECQHCGIIFPDRILYSMHMEYHNKSDPFQCNLCGQRTRDRREFFNHISQVAHK